MRVCHLTTTSLKSHYFANLGTGLARKAVAVHAGTLAEGEPPAWVAQTPGVTHFALHARSRHVYPRAILALARLLRRERIDILQTHLFEAGLIGSLAAMLTPRAAMALTRHHTDQVRLVGSPLHIGLDRWMARRASRVVVLSSSVRDYLIADGLSPELIWVTPQGFDFTTLSPSENDRQRVRHELGIDSQLVIGSVGQLYPTKGQSYLLEALAAVAPDLPDWRLLLLGTGDRESLEGLARRLGLYERVIFAGFRADAAACIRAMDLVVHPSLSEAFCQVIVEAMAIGTPLIATDVGSAREVVENGRTGVLVPPQSAPAIAGAIAGLLRNPEQTRRMAVDASASVRKRFTIERMVEAQIRCYEELLEHRGKDRGVRSSR